MSETSKIPRHVAVIMDGNGRWAQRQGKDRIYGHMQGVESVRTIIKACLGRGVEYLTLYAFSTENWERPADEVDALMELFCTCVLTERDDLREQGVKVCILGDRKGFSDRVRDSLSLIENDTRDGGRLVLILALNYSARWEIARMARNIAQEACDGGLDPQEIDEGVVARHMATAQWPDPDLMIRTSGELRLSNFLLWQLAYSELYFTDVLWPDFTQEDFDRALEVYASRHRRFGRVTINELTETEKI